MDNQPQAMAMLDIQTTPGCLLKIKREQSSRLLFDIGMTYQENVFTIIPKISIFINI